MTTAEFESESCDLTSLFKTALLNHDEPSGIRNSIFLCLGIATVTFFINTATGNYSQVDKTWSIVPFVYTWLMVNDERTLLMAILATIWGVRLTWNFNRRGGYSWPPWTGDEDYRWKYLQQGFLVSVLKNRVAWMLFNLGFICFYQHILLWLIVSPSIIGNLVSKSCGSPPLNNLDYFAAGVLLLGVVMESIADNQQFAFQTEKYRQLATGAEMKGEFLDGFKQSDLFAIVRKPNYSAEQLIWISYYLFSVAATNGSQLLNWSCLGWVLLCALFQGSGYFTELITISRYPKYAEYQKTTPLYLPNPFITTVKDKAS